MKGERLHLRLLLDAGVPDSVGRMFEHHGHSVIYHRDVLPEKTPDPVVATTAMTNDAIFVAIDNDARGLAQKYGATPRGDRFDRLNLIHFCCGEIQAANRLDHAMSFVEHEWSVKEEKSARRMWVEIGAHHLRSNR